VRFQDNPAYRPREPWDMSARARGGWRALLVVVEVALLATGRWYDAGILAALWLAAELVVRLQRRRSPQDHPPEH
jgi:hypothetical protein